MQFSVCCLLFNLGCTACSCTCCFTATWNWTWHPWALWMVTYSSREMFDKPLWKYPCLGPWACARHTDYLYTLISTFLQSPSWIFCSSFFSSKLMKWTLWQVANISLTMQMVQQVNAFRLTDETEVLHSSSCPLVMKNIWVKIYGQNIWFTENDSPRHIMPESLFWVLC